MAKLVTLKEAYKILGISKPTFCKERDLARALGRNVDYKPMVSPETGKMVAGVPASLIKTIQRQRVNAGRVKVEGGPGVPGK